MAVSFESFLPEVLIESPGAPEPVALGMLRNAAIEFCTKSLWWQETQDPEAYIANSAIYDVAAPSGAMVVKILGMSVDASAPVFPQSLENSSVHRLVASGSTGPVLGFVQPDRSTIQLFPIPDRSGVYALRVAYAPSRTATTVPDALHNHQFDAIVNGALARLKTMPLKPWSDPAGASWRQALFSAATNEAKLEALKGFSRADLRVQPREFI